MTYTIQNPITYELISVSEPELRVYQEIRFAEVINDEEAIEECVEWFKDNNLSLYNELFCDE